jgi:hypothetical protein
MPTLRPFRDYDEKDVINIYALSGVTLPVNKGTLVKIANGGLKLDAVDTNEMIGNYGDATAGVSNVVAQRYGVFPKITPITAATDAVIGMTLFDCRETDENGLLLKFNPRKAAEMEAVLSGQAMPLVTRGIFAYSGITTGNGLVGSVSAGAKLYPAANATLTTQAFTGSTLLSYSGTTSAVPSTGQIPGYPIGVALGDSDSTNVTVIKLSI